MSSSGESGQTFEAASLDGQALVRRAALVNSIHRWRNRIIRLATLAAFATIIIMPFGKLGWVLGGAIFVSILVIIYLVLSVVAKLLWSKAERMLTKTTER